MTTRSAPPRFFSLWRLRFKQLGTVSRGPLLSVVLHLLMFGLVLLMLPSAPESPGNTQETWITIRFNVLEKAAPEVPPAPTKPEPDAIPDPTEAIVKPTTPAPTTTTLTPETPRAPSGVNGLSDLEAPTLPSRLKPVNPALGFGPGRQVGPVGVGKGRELFGNRGEGKAEALSLYGGSGGTENAVLRGLAWLAAHQDDDGKWDADGFGRHCTGPRSCVGRGHADHDVGISGLALLAFLGAGFSPGTDKDFGAVLERGLRYLLRSQHSDGRFGKRVEKLFYNHAIATLVVAEAYGMTGENKYREATRRALQYSAHSQQSRGGWDYTDERTGRNDLSVSGWQVMALHTASKLDIPIPAGMPERVKSYLEKSVLPTGAAIYADSGMGIQRKSIAMRAVGMYCRLLMGVSPGDRAIRGAARSLLNNLPSVQKTYEWDKTFQSSYYWYYGSLALFHLGGKQWDAWNHFIKDTLLPTQSSKPHEDGSWRPDGNWIGASGGRVTATAFGVLTLEVYYRYPPLHAYR